MFSEKKAETKPFADAIARLRDAMVLPREKGALQVAKRVHANAVALRSEISEKHDLALRADLAAPFNKSLSAKTIDLARQLDEQHQNVRKTRAALAEQRSAHAAEALQSLRPHLPLYRSALTDLVDALDDTLSIATDIVLRTQHDASAPRIISVAPQLQSLARQMRRILNDA